MVAITKSMSNSHRLLRRLREVMAGADLSPQEKLSQIVTLIAYDMKADTCAVYIQRGGAELELFAACGLNQGAVRRTFIRTGKGVVGDVVEKARPLVLSDIRSHKRFYLDPKIGEDKLNAFLGTPLARGGRVFGALVLQNQEKRLYTHDEVEILQTVAMVLSEMMIAGNLINPNELKLSSSDGDIPSTHLRGVSLNHGMAKGRAVLHQPIVSIKRLVCEDSGRELNRLFEAVAQLRLSLKSLFSQHTLENNDESQEILETYQLFAQDRGWLNRIQKAIESGLTAEAAIQKTLTSLRFRISQTKDSYFRDRLWDFEDLTNRLLKLLVGNDNHEKSFQSEGIIVVARSMGPAELLDYSKAGIKGLLLEEGLHTAHVSIIARALKIPVISRLPDILTKIEHGDLILLDSDRANVTIQPSEEELEKFDVRVRKLEKRKAQNSLLRKLPCVSLDKVNISLSLNAGSPVDLEALKENTLDGVGLYRSEIPFMMEACFPDVKVQERIYRDIFQKVGETVITFRTLDIGGDKLLPYMRKPEEGNPILGWRAIRIGLDRPILLKHQIRALLTACEGKSFNLMFPMIASAKEYYKAKKLFDREVDRALKKGLSVPKIQVGAMVEVPSFAWEIDTILPELDFISVGSNDLFQFFYAVDRTNISLVDRYDCLSIPFLTFLRRLVTQAKQHKTKISLCGEMAGNPIESLALLGIGFRSLSVASYHADSIKQMIRSLNLGEMTSFIEDLLKKKADSIRPYLHHYALDKGILCED